MFTAADTAHKKSRNYFYVIISTHQNDKHINGLTGNAVPKSAIPLLFLLISLNAHAFEQERLERACRIEQGSLVKRP